jgi:carboxyl-terminal processing protease
MVLDEQSRSPLQTTAAAARKVSLTGLVLAVSWLGITVGQSLTRQVVVLTAQAHAATTEKGSSTKDPALTNAQERYENLELFQKVLHFVEANYVDPVKNKDLMYGAIKGMLETLDPHSNFLPPDVFRDMKIDTSGKFGGLGIEIGMKDNVLTVVAPIEDTPAWKAGLKPNDRIVKINGESTKGMTLTEAVAKMRGKKGTPVQLSVYREGWEKIRDLSVTRDTIKIQSVKSDELEPSFGYVRLTSFNESAASDIKKALDKLETKQKLRGLVFDLRTNPGGLLDQAVEVSSLFVDDGVVVSTVGRNKDVRETKYAKRGSARKDFPVAILVNSSTASAAEIVAGALQDHHRAIIMGQPTFGKGSVQTVIELGNEIGLKLTIARYYTPSGRSIQEKGVSPDITLDDFDPKLLAEARRKGEYFREKDLKGHMANPEKGDDDYNAKQTQSLTQARDKKGDFRKEELDMIAKGGAKKDKKGDAKGGALDEDELTPTRMNPKEDFQVREALNYLKSYEIFQKIANRGGGTAVAQPTAGTAAISAQ